ncbi:hypothetical protein HG537_0B04460 [Torulaspora globosa]|uniref:Uncharacterized protein n=1 Tax=Torulaspora globosa TaxID=48254 RepID=A0A7H9HMU8_9SACH|nr:hypothetical protein HG537_0B04460 [Torulaspora sp. CBS 2947]
MDTARRRRDWTINDDDINCFLKPVNFSQDDVHSPETTVASECLLQLQKICDSLQRDHVLITDRICFSNRIWDLHTYKEDPSAFPIQNVQIKCNILSSMSELLRNHYDEVKVSKVLNYLQKLSEAALFTKQSKPVRTLDPSRTPRKSHRDGSLGYGSLAIDNITKFHEYKPLIISLHSKLKLLDQGNSTNDSIFAFVLHNICKFILQDCKLLLIDYIERQILNL